MATARGLISKLMDMFKHTPTKTRCRGEGMYIKPCYDFDVSQNLLMSNLDVSESLFLEIKKAQEHYYRLYFSTSFSYPNFCKQFFKDGVEEVNTHPNIPISHINEALAKNNSYADKLKSKLDVNSFAAVIKTNKNDDLIQERERERRSANVIIYGISEISADNQNIAKEHDEKFVHSLLGTIGVTSLPKHIIRLDKPIAGKTRHVKLVMTNSRDKDNIMSRLVNLKNAEEIYHKISVRDDYTIEEREMIKEWVKKAAQKNKENTQSWKVRGTPKNGLRLVKITKRS